MDASMAVRASIMLTCMTEFSIAAIAGDGVGQEVVPEAMRVLDHIAPRAGAKFRYLAASTVEQATGTTLFPPYAVKEFDGIPIAFIGLTLKGTPEIVTPAGVAGLSFGDEAQTVNALVPQLRARGIEAIVVLVHEGGQQTGDYNECKDLTGPIVDIVRTLDQAVDVVISGHTHRAYNCVIDGRISRPFEFHHSERSTWIKLLGPCCNCGFAAFH